ncbi:hypothetical protein LCGC14_2705600 [marine sediment metagenome]|uniref:Uncharacterized protein n=1 Tax=marine sediment metagenome TaxID=412755 RepID=A0A0F8ZED0_9ZZZZ
MAAYTNTTIIADTTDVAGFMGKDVDAGYSVTMQDLLGVYIEGYLCNLVEYDIVTNWASLNAIYKLMFSEYACRSIAVAAIQYEMAGFGTDEDSARIHGEDLINIHLFRINEIERLLKMASVQDFMSV